MKITFSGKGDELNVHVIGDVHQDEDSKVPEASTLQLSGIAAVEEALTGGTQVAVMQRLQDPPQVPAQTVVQALPGDGQWLQHLLQAIVSVKQGKKEESENIFQARWQQLGLSCLALQVRCIIQVIEGTKGWADLF